MHLGMPYRRDVAPFGETVFFCILLTLTIGILRRIARCTKVEATWRRAVWCVNPEQSNEHLLHTGKRSGACSALSGGLAEKDRCDRTLSQAVAGVVGTTGYTRCVYDHASDNSLGGNESPLFEATSGGV